MYPQLRLKLCELLMYPQRKVKELWESVMYPQFTGQAVRLCCQISAYCQSAIHVICFATHLLYGNAFDMFPRLLHDASASNNIDTYLGAQTT